MKRLLASALIAAMTLTGLAASPAAAMDRGDRDKLLLGLTALAIIGAVASARNDRDDHVGRGQDDWRHDGRQGRRDDWRHSRNSLPVACQFSIRSHRGVSSVLGRSCLDQFGFRSSSLPRHCAFDIRTSQGSRDVYGSQCLRDAGYRIEARR